MLSGTGMEAVKIPPRSPRASAYAERQVRTVRVGATDRMLIAGPRHLHAVLGEHTAHFSQHRPHWARGLRPAGAAGSTGLSEQGRCQLSQNPRQSLCVAC
jgi:hypothetical protein